MENEQSLTHTKWECKYHIVFIPKCRRKAIYEKLRKHLGGVFRQLAVQKESEILARISHSPSVRQLVRGRITLQRTSQRLPVSP